jgi:antibiotic biosynthesis monooxygenase (ABM) superfamily enzyme
VIRPDDPANQDYLVVFRFAKAEQLARSEQSETRATWLSRVEPLTVGEPHIERVTGLEYWFQLPDHAAPFRGSSSPGIKRKGRSCGVSSVRVIDTIRARSRKRFEP